MNFKRSAGLHQSNVVRPVPMNDTYNLSIATLFIHAVTNAEVRSCMKNGHEEI
jgi:hypothetical protein